MLAPIRRDDRRNARDQGRRRRYAGCKDPLSVSPIEFCPIPLRAPKPTLESLPKSRRTLIGMPFLPKIDAREIRPVAPAAEALETIEPTLVTSVRRRAHVVPPRPARRRPTAATLPEVKPPMGKAASVALGIVLGLALTALGSVVAAHAHVLVALLG